ncbi:hypothetical protein BDA96_01G098700 [Sorghum bicolor]|uniref:Uncharacterized protein n=2 Tax=Sorghum bicolor TaxID=4558 RepID=A0A921RX60_SORBI|nr:hypothetical protein BDA96_01G098700 [Sorghum bicolor]OQU91013.1 hypothetical protein SORBI_3001G094550 [Sorghum bicolor]
MDDVHEISLSILSTHQIPITKQQKGLRKYHFLFRSSDQIINQSSRNIDCPNTCQLLTALASPQILKP